MAFVITPRTEHIKLCSGVFLSKVGHLIVDFFEIQFEFFPLIMKYAKKYGLDIKVDCSYVPMVCFHGPDRKLMEKFHIRGCDAGNLLAAVDSKGNLKACSFAAGSAGMISDFRGLWDDSEHFLRFTRWKENAPEPCASCRYLDLCLGGCHVVAEFITGSFDNPDPGYTRVPLCQVGHQGLLHDREFGLVVNRARYLHTRFGRFTGRDPLGYVDTPNLYEYVASGPVGWLDLAANVSSQ